MPNTALKYEVTADPVAWLTNSLTEHVGKTIAIDPSHLPEQYEWLLRHRGSMTSRLERQFTSRIVLRSLTSCVNDEFYARWSVLLDEYGRCLALGGIWVRLDGCADPVRADILKGTEPLGRLLSISGVQYESVPKAYFATEPDAEFCELLQMKKPLHVFGRRTDLLLVGKTCGEVIEVLPRYEFQRAVIPMSRSIAPVR